MPFLKSNPVSLEQKRYLVGYDEGAFLAAYSTSLLGKRHSFAAILGHYQFQRRTVIRLAGETLQSWIF